MPHLRRVTTVDMLCAIIATVAVAAWAGDAVADRYGPYDHRYHYGYPRDDLGVRRDLIRLQQQMRVQRSQLQEQIRLQEEQIRLLRQQVSAQHNITAMQACYYRLSAGIETCEDLFESDSPEYLACYRKVIARNPGCSLEAPRPKAGSKD